MADVTHNGDALNYASLWLKDDHETVMAAVKQSPRAGAHASTRLQKDHDIQREWLRKWSGQIYSASGQVIWRV